MLKAANAAPIGCDTGPSAFSPVPHSTRIDTNERLLRARKGKNMTNEATEKQLAQAKHRLEEVRARDRVKERKARTRQLIQKGAIIESVMPETNDMDLDELRDYLFSLSKRQS